MRIWDFIPPYLLCRQHLLAEHKELHQIYNTVTHPEYPKIKLGWRNHPDVKRWYRHLNALKHRHNLLVEEMCRRQYNHKTSLPQIAGEIIYPTPLISSNKMIELLYQKSVNQNCSCLKEA